MLRTMRWLACASCLLLCPVLGQSPAMPPCGDEFNCQEGAYCDLDAHVCRKCISCEDFKRKPPETSSGCIKSIIECGSCVEGDIRCSGEPTSYVWLAVVAALLLLALVIFIVVFAVRNLDTIKIRATASASVQQPRGQFEVASPESPPPYTPPYAQSFAPPRPYANAPPTEFGPAPEYDSDYTPREDSIRPFITRGSKGRAPGATEVDESQEAFAYTPPYYVRPPSADGLAPYSPSQQPPAHSAHSLDTRDGTLSNGNASDAPADAARASAAPAAASRHLQPFQHDSNNNGSNGEGSAPPDAPAPPAAHAPFTAATPSVLINMNVNMMNTQQNVKNVSVNMQQNNQQ